MYTSAVTRGTAYWKRGSKCVHRVYLWGSVNFEGSGKYASMVRVDEKSDGGSEQLLEYLSHFLAPRL
jgi:hypothetical protein